MFIHVMKSNHPCLVTIVLTLSYIGIFAQSSLYITLCYVFLGYRKGISQNPGTFLFILKSLGFMEVLVHPHKMF